MLSGLMSQLFDGDPHLQSQVKADVCNAEAPLAQHLTHQVFPCVEQRTWRQGKFRLVVYAVIPSAPGADRLPGGDGVKALKAITGHISLSLFFISYSVN